jgi:hypothetical protein
MEHTTARVELCVHFFAVRYYKCITEYMFRTEEMGCVGVDWIHLARDNEQCTLCVYDNEHWIV